MGSEVCASPPGEREDGARMDEQTSGGSSRSRRSWCGIARGSIICCMALLLLGFVVAPTHAAKVPFENCMDESRNPDQLQFTPNYVDATFNLTNESHPLMVTVFGNVSGRMTQVQLPPAGDPYWNDDKQEEGKIVKQPGGLNYTGLKHKIDVLSYEPWSQNIDFCDNLNGWSCPLGPAFDANLYVMIGTSSKKHLLTIHNRSDHTSFPSFTMHAELNATYQFVTLTSTFYITSGDARRTQLGCISAQITPDLGTKWSNMLTYIPLGVLILVGVATVSAGVFSPWGSTNIFKWTTNYGRDADLLRLVTPGFADCLQYIQFIVLTGGLTLSYPGFYQPVASKVAWSSLMFNQSFISHGNGTDPVVDGLYTTTGKYGLEKISQLVGMTSVSDMWAGMAIWLLVMLTAVIVLLQIGFLLQWAYHKFQRTQEEDLRAKNLPFTIGNIVRFIFSYFLLPIVALSMFQLVEAKKSPVVVVAMAAVLLIILLAFACWLLKVVAATRPRSFLFDDLLTLLIYGSLYNTYSDNAAPFALVPVLLTIIRGTAIGAVQPSGIAQLVLLAICEVITILTLHTFRPFHSPTSMNAYHTFFAAARFVSILLMVAFAPSLGIQDGTKAWVGYGILLLHGIVLIFGFFLNALQTIFEVLARLAGLGIDDNNGFAKAFGMRQLSRRLSRNNGHVSRHSQSSTAMLVDRKSPQIGGPPHMRSQSAGSMNMLLEGARPIDGNHSSPNLDNNSAYTPTTVGAGSAFSFIPSGAPGDTRGANGLGLTAADPGHRYYRAPRVRRPTNEPLSPGAKARGSFTSLDWARRGSQASIAVGDEGPSISGRASPTLSPPPQLGGGDLGLAQLASYENRRSKTDYTTREVDFYYGVRGPALNSNTPSRKLRTGPADPTNPVTVASGWFKNLLGGKSKEKGRGFEVVRSGRMPPGLRIPQEGAETPPEGIPVVASGAIRRDLDDDQPTNVTPPRKPTRSVKSTSSAGKRSANHHSDDEDGMEEIELQNIGDAPPAPPKLTVSTGRGLQMPSRLPSVATAHGKSAQRQLDGANEEEELEIPVPRKSSRRMSHGSPVASRPNIGSPSSVRIGAGAGQTDYFGPRLPRPQPANNNEPLISMADEPSPGPSPAPSALDSHVRNDRPQSVGRVSMGNVLLTDQAGDAHPGRTAEIISPRSRASGDSGMGRENRR